ncbi:L-galactose dehydrogenase [Colletotrichum asianum]|uniref:L-galactose dehydrogenase n=1 Tax=Colletotrichum asianum TaxID=702518 RepID=A0A8H3W2Q3_9PEZI|nr:L-galactose dehydrogenase [Colletotrichum asianum]
MATTTTSLNRATRPSVASVLPPLFLGTATFNTQHVKDPLQMPYRQIVSRALELGVNGFDTSPYYGPSEVLLGDALAAHTAATNIPRESYVLVTKAGRIAGNEFDYSPAYVRYSVLRSLNRLNTSYLDLVYMHDVEFVSPSEVLAAVQTLRQLRDEGKIRFVGISGFPVHVLCSLAEMILAETGEPLDAILSYGHFTIQNPTLGYDEVVAGADHTNDQSPLRRFRNAGVQVVLNASMLGMGLLTHTGIPTNSEQSEGKAGVIAKWHPAPDDLRTACKKLSTFANEAGERLETIALHWSMEEYARVGALAGLGVQLPGQGDLRVGGSVMGVTNVSELEQTVDAWKKVLEGMGASTETGSAEKYEKLKALVEQKMWPALGEWKGYSWASPDDGFQNERSVKKMGTIPAEDELMKIVTRISSNFLNGPSGPIDGCREAMKSLETLFRTDTASQQGLSRSKKLKGYALVTSATLAWPLKESKARKLLQDVATYKDTIMLALTANTAHRMRDMAQRTGQIQEAVSEAERRELFKWLEESDPSSLHHRAQDNHEPDTCDWATRLLEWPEFLSGKEHCLWIHGIPGAGKTILASQLIDKIEQHCKASGSGRLVSIWYYCYFAHNQDESASLLKWILSRLCRTANEISDHLWKLFRHGGAPSLKDLLVAIEWALEHFDEVYITVDATDESNPREDLLKVMRKLATDVRFSKIRLLLTSREYFDIEAVMTEFSTPISMKNKFLDADIRLYTESRLRAEKRVKSWSAELQQETIEALSNGAQGMFRSKRKKDFPYVNSAMKWLCFESKLHSGAAACVDMQMLAQAVDEDICEDNPEGEELFYDAESLREICGSLITLRPTSRQRFNVSFAHYTVLEYLASSKRHNPDPFFTLEKNGLVLEKAERIFLRAMCVSDDEFEEYQAVTQTEHGYQVISTLPSFGSYCAFTSIDIIICFDALLSKHSVLLYRALDVLDAEKHYYFPLFYIWSHRAKTLVKHTITTTKYHNPDMLRNIEWETIPDLEIQVLVRLLIFGCVHVARVLLERMEPRKTFQGYLDFRYYSSHIRGVVLESEWHYQGSLTDCFAALFPATTMYNYWSGNIKVFKLLIEAGAGNFDPQGALIPFGPLHQHSRDCGDCCVLEKLLSLGANPNPSGCYITPLQIAVATFDEEGVLALLQAGANPNAEGRAAASAWPEDTLLFDFNGLNGWRPLQISKRISDPEGMFRNLRDWSLSNGEDAHGEAKTIQSSIGAILLEYGANI